MAEKKDETEMSDDDFIIEEDEDFEVVRNEPGIKDMEREEKPKIKESIILPEKEKKTVVKEPKVVEKVVEKKVEAPKKKVEKKEAPAKKEQAKKAVKKPAPKPKKVEKKQLVVQEQKSSPKMVIKRNKRNLIVVIQILVIVLAAILIWKNLFDTDVAQGIPTAPAGKGVTLKTIISNNCEECKDPTNIGNELISNGVNIIDQQIIEYESEEGKATVEKYNITRLPTLIFSKEIESYKDFPGVWENVGSIEEDGSHIMRLISPPFYDTEKEEVVGLVSIVYLVDESCEECYDAKIHRNVIDKLEVVVKEEETVDINSEEGEYWLEKYDIRYVPTIIISDDVSLYAKFAEVWEPVGSVEEDGYFVFRNLTALSKITYRDLETNEIIIPEEVVETTPETDDEEAGETETSEPTGGQVSFALEAEKYLFRPRTITVNEGDEVKLYIISNDVEHTFELEVYNINEVIPAGEEITVAFVANKKGEFTFSSNTHDAMKGRLIVE